MLGRKPVYMAELAAAYARAYPVATAASAREFFREHGLKSTDYRESCLFRCLHHEHGWRTDKSLWKAVLHRAPESTTEDCLKFCAKWGITLRPVEGEAGVKLLRATPSKRTPTYKGVPDLLAYVKRAAEECGVVKGYRWYYYGLPF